MKKRPLPRTKLNIVYSFCEIGLPVSCQLIARVIKQDQVTVQEVVDEWQQFLHKQSIAGQKCYSFTTRAFRIFCVARILFKQQVLILMISTKQSIKIYLVIYKGIGLILQ